MFYNCSVCLKRKNILLKSSKKVVILIISNGEKWCYLAVQNLLALLRRIKSKQKKWFLLFELPSFLSNKNHI